MAGNDDPASSAGAAGLSNFENAGELSTILRGEDDAPDAIVRTEQVPFDQQSQQGLPHEQQPRQDLQGGHSFDSIMFDSE